jgi:hypothetical protein
MALREAVDIEIVMELGGWEDRDSMDPYLDANFDDIIQRELALAGVLDEDVDTEPTRYDRLREEIRLLREAVEDLDRDLSVPEREDDQPALADFA